MADDGVGQSCVTIATARQSCVLLAQCPQMRPLRVQLMSIAFVFTSIKGFVAGTQLSGTFNEQGHPSMMDHYSLWNL